MVDRSRVSVGIIGASGYGGVQLVRLLQDHPGLEITYLAGDSSAGKPFADLYPHLAPILDLTIEPIDLEAIASRCEVVFLSLPNGLACQMAPVLLEKGCKVLDLSADYRFSDLDTYRQWYGGDRQDQTQRDRCERRRHHPRTRTRPQQEPASGMLRDGQQRCGKQHRGRRKHRHHRRLSSIIRCKAVVPLSNSLPARHAGMTWTSPALSRCNTAISVT